MIKKEIFWLHVKKSAGQSTRAMLTPHYKQVDRSQQPACFIQSERQYWNDILNNFRVPLGELQFKRCLFAKNYLWKLDFNSLFKFAFVRNPSDRCVSQFFYLWSQPEDQSFISYGFDQFLDAIESSRASKSNYEPFGLHFQSHTADMWSDITDFEDNVLLDKVWRMEDIHEGINYVRDIFGDGPIEMSSIAVKNQSKRRSFAISAGQRLKIEKLFAKDFELYESS